ncbi:glutathione-independent formaldehyde dehydrogenase [Aspergillus affinis]|uniref:glutathione-independent formaldehyde dehydrogenase n=1 Tax=Aspergillus affinis TaxID=1070780 RepID=UPI0022FDFB17|nr:alcohol dehydrogenase [Aspergillus affinis]KAI9045853.1 alcohol dehydrogenase [Aspergillus affinis]
MALNATMRGVVFDGTPFQVSVVDLPRPNIINHTDAVVRITTSAICGSDLHMYHGFQGGTPPWGMGHEAIGYISELGNAVSSLAVGDYVVIPDNVGSGHLEMEPESLQSYGGGSGLDGLQAEYARVPFADDSLIPVPLTHNSTNSSIERDYLTVSDIFATGWSAVDYSGFEPGDTVAVFGAGPVGLLAAYSALLRGASRVYSVDHVPMRLERAASIGAIPINFNESDPVQQILERESLGVTRALDCVGMEAINTQGDIQEDIILQNMVGVVAQNGGLGQVGVYMAQSSSAGAPLGDTIAQNITFPVTEFFGKHLRYEAGVVDPKVLAPQLVELIAAGRAHPSFISTASIRLEEAPRYYERFDRHEEIKVYIHFP